MALCIPLTRRDDLVDAALLPGEWRPTRPGEQRHRVSWAVVACPLCGKLGTLTRKVHAVDYEGRVSPAVTCPHGGCPLAAPVRLMDWVPEAVGSA